MPFPQNILPSIISIAFFEFAVVMKQTKGRLRLDEEKVFQGILLGRGFPQVGDSLAKGFSFILFCIHNGKGMRKEGEGQRKRGGKPWFLLSFKGK